MTKTEKKQQKILKILLQKEEAQSSDIHAEIVKLGEEISSVTVKRILSEMVKNVRKS